MSHVIPRIGLASLVLALAAAVASAGAIEFTARPTAVKDGGNVRISFAVSAPTDVEVAVLDGKDSVTRHLAAGLLGKNAPEPFQRDSLAQEVLWDCKDDAGRPAAGGPFRVRVRLGLQPRLDKVLGRNDNTLSGDVCALTVSPKGELFVLLADPFRGRAELRVLDRQGRYLRTVMPYAASTPEARTEPVGHVKIDGRRQPLVFNGQAHSLYPLVAGLRSQTMAWHPDGYLLAASAIGSMCNHGPARHLLAFHPEGGAPEKTGFVGPQIRKARGFLGGAGEGYAIGMDRLACISRQCGLKERPAAAGHGSESYHASLAAIGRASEGTAPFPPRRWGRRKAQVAAAQHRRATTAGRRASPSRRRLTARKRSCRG